MNTFEPMHFEKCLIHQLKTPDGEWRQYVLPYTGNLLESKLKELATRLEAAVKHHYPTATLFDYIARLRSEWLTGREKDVKLYVDSHGLWNLSGKGWSRAGYPEGFFVILDKAPCYSDC